MTTLAQYDRVRAALASATRIDEVLPILDEIEHVKLYARQIRDRELLAEASEFQMRAERRLGIVITAAKAAGHFAEGRRKKPNNGSESEPFSGATLDEVGVDKKLSARSQKHASISEQAFENVIRAHRERVTAGTALKVDVEINGARAIMGSRIEPDDSLDYFPTPPWATRALAQHVMPALKLAGRRFAVAWEPACGEGHIADVLAEYSDILLATDIHDYGYGQSDIDFLADDLPPSMVADWIITNPPFGKKTEQFVLRAIERARVGVAMFVRMQWLETSGRYERIFSKTPPTMIAFFAERVPLCKGEWKPEGDTATAYVWLVWVKDRTPQAPFWIPPGCRIDLEKPDDVTRFTTRPVMSERRVVHFAGDDLVDANTGEIIEPEAQRDPTDKPPSLASSGDEPRAFVEASCTHDAGATDQPHGVLQSPHLDSESEAAPAASPAAVSAYPPPDADAAALLSDAAMTAPKVEPVPLPREPEDLLELPPLRRNPDNSWPGRAE